MALVLADRVRETTTTTGTGTVSLAGPVSGFQGFSTAIGNANTTYYTIVDASTGAWEVGLGTYTSSGSTLARTTILSSSNAGAAVNFAAGTKDVFVTQPAERALYLNGAGTGIDAGVASFTANGVVYASSTSALATGSALTFDGTYFTVGTSSTTGDYKAFIQKAGGELLGLNASSGTLARIAFGNATATFGSTQIIANAADLAFITNSAEKLRLTATSLYTASDVNVGIGTSTPVTKLTVGDPTGAGLGIPSTASFYGTNSISSSIGTVGLFSTETAGVDVGPVLTFGGKSGNTFSPYPFAFIQGAKESATAGNYAGYLRFVTVPSDGGSPVEGMRLTSVGNVGIGTSTPAVRMHVQGSAGQLMRVTDGTTGASIYSGGGLFGFNNQTGEDGMFGSTASHYLYFATNGAERMRLDSAGKLSLSLANGQMGFASGNTASGVKIQAFNAAGNADGYLAFEGFTKEYGRFDSAGKLSIGTFGDTGRKLEVLGSEALLDGAGQFDLIIGDGGVAYMSLTTTDNATALKIRNYSGNSDIAVFERATGNVGIGASSPDASFRLTVGGNSAGVGPGVLFTDSAASPTNYALYTNGNKNFVLRNQAGGGVTGDIWTATPAGNLGLGVTPTGKAKFELYTGAGAYAGFSTRFNATNFPISFGVTNANGVPYLGVNARQVSGTDGQTYDIDGFASRMWCNGGGFAFFTAPSGTAGNAITFTQAMTLTAAGALLVGATSPFNATADVGLFARSQASLSRVLIDNQNITGSSGFEMSAYGGGWSLEVPGSFTFVNPLLFKFGATERARITSGGELLVGTTSAPNTNAKIRSSSGIQYNNSVLLDVLNPNGKVFTITGGSNGSSTFVEIEILTYEGYFKAVYFCINSGGSWENDKYNEVTSGTPATVTVAGNGSATLTLTVACTTSFTPLMRVAMGSNLISLS